MRRPALLLCLLALFAAAPFAALAKPIPIKVVILTTFEQGEDTGDRPGEFQYWVERFPLTEQMTVPGVDHPVRYNKDGVLGMVTGMRARARESVAALALSPEFDLSHAYWIVAGIAGVDPRAGSIGSAAWAKWVVDADATYEMDDREIPADWPYGIYSLNTDRPGVKGSAPGSSGMVWKLDPGLAEWAYDVSRDVALPDSPLLQAARAQYPSEPEAQRPPRVFIGDVLGTTRFWHGDRRTQWARDWVKLWTDGQGQFVMTDCEDQGIMDVLELFSRSGRVDLKRVMVLRTASNYSREGDGAVPTLKFSEGGAPAAFDAAYRVGAPVVKALLGDWRRYETTVPGAAGR